MARTIAAKMRARQPARRPFGPTKIFFTVKLYEDACILFHDRTSTPRLGLLRARLLNELTIIYDGEFRDVVEHDIHRHLQGGIYPYEGIDSDTSRNMLRTYSKLNAMIVVSPKTLPLLAKREELVQHDDLESMQRAFAGSSSWVYAIRRFPST
jgi:hypothetical protein